VYMIILFGRTLFAESAHEVEQQERIEKLKIELQRACEQKENSINMFEFYTLQLYRCVAITY